MYKVKLRKSNREKRKLKIRETLHGVPEKPRLSIYRSNRYTSAQIIDDTVGKTLVDVMAETKKIHHKKSKVEAAKEAGNLLAKKAIEKGIKEIAFDRNGYKFHGRIKSFADAAREGGLKF